jgi:hypothetical protein
MPPTAVSDSTVQISTAKAKEMGLKAGDAVVLVGRRRRASYARVEVVDAKELKKLHHHHAGSSAMSKKPCVVPENLARNLRLRQDDTVKIVPLTDDDESAKADRSGDLQLLSRGTRVPALASVTFSPVAESLESLQASEGDVSDEEIQERFIGPYTEDSASALIKLGSIVTMVDDNGKRLDLVVTGAELEEEEGRGDTEKDSPGT